ncbi:EthD domain-containing protein [Novosphingobium colocasiae]|uniref:EthD domain-containing protein n=1 Tax=Novosphingobium colocasiae TaxID=1256513 RepID=UPI0035B00680
MIRLVCLLAPRAGLSVPAFHAVLRDRVGPLVAGMQTGLDLIRYVQLLADADAAEGDAAARAMRDMPPSPHAAMMDFWWASAAAVDAACAGALLDRIGAAVAEVVDPQASCCWLASEFPQVQTQHARVVARPRTPLLKLAFMLRPATGMTDAEARDYWLTGHGPLIRSYAPARGMHAYYQVHRRDDRERLPKLAAALGLAEGDFMGHAEAWFDRSAMRGGADLEEAKTKAVEDERRFIGLAGSVLFSGKEYAFVERDWAL